MTVRGIFVGRHYPIGLLGVALAVLAACDSVVDFTEPRSEYEGTTWIAEDIGGNGVIDILQSRLTFDEEGRVNGNAGCNSFFGSYQTGDLVPKDEIDELALDDTDGETDETMAVEDVEVAAEVDAVEGVEPIRFSPMATTQMACEPAVADQELAFLNALGQAATVHVDEGIMYLDDAEGNNVMRLSQVEVAAQ
jgi:putative lipoprotein